MCNKSVWLIVMVLGLLAAPAATLAQVTNLALNPSFEEDELILNDPDWTNWATWGDGDGLNATVEIDDTEFIDGAKSLRIMPKGVENWQFIVLNLPIPLELGKKYTVSFWAKAKEARPLTVQFKDTANKPVTWGLTTFQLTTEWAEYTMTAPAQDASMKLEFFCAASDVVFWMDFVNIYLGDYVAGIEPSEIGGQGMARQPVPADGAADTPRDVVLSWKPAKDSQGRNVYLGTDPEAVANADAANPMGVLVGTNLTETTYAPIGLEFGQTCYWRVDEIGLPPESAAVKGAVWSFTVEPYAYPITGVTATASSFQPGMTPQNAVNGSGLNADDQHSTESTQMWMTSGGKPAWIQFEFAKVEKLHEMWVWNSNQMIEAFIGFGAKNVTVEYSTDGATWATLADAPEFAKATGTAANPVNTKVSFGGVLAKYVKLTINANWGGVAPQTGLAEVRFFQIPAQARLPIPADGAAGVGLDAELNWRPGRDSTSHKVFFGVDEAAVAAGTAAASTVTAHAFAPAAMQFGTEYFWKVDEIADAGTYAGPVWSFVSQEFAAIDDFEAYNDDDNRIYNSWIDGVTDNSSGSTVGYMAAPFAEQTIVHGGKQAMPLAYDNSKAPYFSEATVTLDAAVNCTGSGATELCVWTRGYPAPAAVAVTEAAGKMSLTGAGADIWNNSDEFTYAYKTLTGNGAMIARVTSIGPGTNTWAKGGVMIRDSLKGGSTHAMTVMTANTDGAAGNGASFQYRSVANGASGNADSALALKPPYWVKVERQGGVLIGSTSADGKSWAVLGQTEITMEDPVLIGLCVTSHAAGEDRTFQFENIATTGTVSGAWQGVVINSPEFNDATDMYLIVEDSAGKTAMATSATAVNAADWTRWGIPMSGLKGVNFAKIAKLTIGVGNKTAPTAGSAGMVFIDDIGYGRSAK